jgi:CBS domain-containing protein
MGMTSLEGIMTRDVVTINQDADLYDAIRMMADGNITGLPVLDDAERLVGIVTEKDLLNHLLETNSTDGKVRDCMTLDVVTSDLHDNLLDVMRTLVENGFRRVPVVSEGRMLGIVSRRDIILYLFGLQLKDRGVIAASLGGKVFSY